MALVCDQLGFQYPGSRAEPIFAGLNLTIEPGRVTAILGPNGSGKSTLVRLMLGLLRPTQGIVKLGDVSVHAMDELRRARALVLIPQQPRVAFAFRALDIAAMGAGELLAAPHARSMAREVLESLGLTQQASVPFSQLSVGQQQLVVLGRALVQIQAADRLNPGKPLFLLADEPVSAMDPKHTLLTASVFQSLARAGHGVVVVLHDLNLALAQSEQAVLLGPTGQIAAQGTTQEVLHSETIEQVFGVRMVQLHDPVSDAQAIVAVAPQD